MPAAGVSDATQEYVASPSAPRRTVRWLDGPSCVRDPVVKERGAAVAMRAVKAAAQISVRFVDVFSDHESRIPIQVIDRALGIAGPHHRVAPAARPTDRLGMDVNAAAGRRAVHRAR